MNHYIKSYRLVGALGRGGNPFPLPLPTEMTSALGVRVT